MVWLWVASALLALIAVGIYAGHRYIFNKYVPLIVRIFQEKPLFIIPFGKPTPDAEEVTLASTHGLRLHGCYLKSRRPRKGVILFGIEYGSNCWSCVPYCEFLVENGYDVFAFETRGQGQSPTHNGYDPLQWVTEFELDDFAAALTYLKNRPDADKDGIGFFGLSKGGSAGLMAAARDQYIRCCAVDGIFAPYTTMIPYMMKWISIYTHREYIAWILPSWYYGYAARVALRDIEKERGCTFPFLENLLPQIAPRPLLMIHGGADNYIKPDMAQKLYDRARQPKELWLVEGAKHNQAIHVAGDEYKKRVLEFFDRHLARTLPRPFGPNGELTTEHGAAPPTQERTPVAHRVES